MSLNRVKFRKFLLVAGLLAVLVLGLTEVPELQDYLFPTRHLEVMLRSARNERWRTEEALTALRARLEYLAWFQAPGSQDQEISWERFISFPFSEVIRRRSPQLFLEVNFFLAKKGKVKVERKLKYFDAVMHHIDVAIKKLPPCEPTDPSAKLLTGITPLEQNQEFHRQMLLYDRTLNELIDRLTSLENTMQNK